jgi:lysosomal acid lipase/cholesteryl ester hydrolase
VELCELFGYYAEEHIVLTKDSYLLGLHRLGWRRGEEDMRVNSGKNSLQKKVVYLHHGLLMNSEVWVCLTERERCLPFLLVEKGYDVWLGNNRGNKYSKKSTTCAPSDVKFWDFSIDQFAFHDIPNSIDYILETTHQPSLSYVGFSQGTAQAFATLSIHPTLNDKVDVFIALAPAMAPPGLTSGIVDSFIKASPDVLFLAFGRRAILTSATMWQAILYPPIFVRLMEMSLSFLFGWKCLNIEQHQKLAAFPHLYSFTSTKSVVHWFQIIRNGKFQMYDDEVQAPFSISNAAKYYKVARVPTRNIKTPIVLVYGGSDSLVDIKVIQKELPRHAIVQEVPHYEHLDFLWASDVETQVFPHVFSALEKYAGTGPDGDVESVKSFRRSSPRVRPVSKFSDIMSPSEDEDTTDNTTSPLKHSENVSDALDATAPSFRPKPSRVPVLRAGSPTATTEVGTAATETASSRPEVWWSSDEVGGTELSSPATKSPDDGGASKLGGSSLIHPIDDASPAPKDAQNSKMAGSKTTLKGFGGKGFSLGASKAVGALNKDVSPTATKGTSGSEGVGEKRKKKKRTKE